MRVKPTYKLANAVRYEQGEHLWYEGNVYDNPLFEDGSWIHTSLVLAEVSTTGDPDTIIKIVTLNSQYLITNQGEG
jgi:hypothetical protein